VYGVGCTVWVLNVLESASLKSGSGGAIFALIKTSNGPLPYREWKCVVRVGIDGTDVMAAVRLEVVTGDIADADNGRVST
jgi:hypothetical protein